MPASEGPDDQRRGPGARHPALTSVLLDSVAEGVYVVDADGRLTLLNRAGERLLGYAEAELLGRDMHAAVHFQDANGHPKPAQECPLMEVLRTGGAAAHDADHFTRRDGRVIEVAWSSSAVLEEGEVVGAVISFRDVTRERATERRAATLAADRLRAGEELQRSLLPDELGDVPGMDFAVSFRPVGEESLLGGDFYDLIPAPGGHLLVLGDVRGKGAGAAAVAAMVRYLLRGAAGQDVDPRRLLGLVDAELREHSERFVTLVLVSLTPRDDGRVSARVSCAGHPQPVLLRGDGSAAPVGGQGPLLGVLEDFAVRTEETVLDQGDSLVLYSDGLIDVGRREGRDGVDVAAVLEGRAATSSTETLSYLEQAAGVLDVKAPLDDIAVLVAHCRARVRELDLDILPAGRAPLEQADIGGVEVDFRSNNERLVAGRPETEPVIAVLCECGHPDCAEFIDLPRELYDRVRQDDRAFVVLPGHQLERAEDIVERHPGVLVVVKHGEAGDVAAHDA